MGQLVNLQDNANWRFIYDQRYTATEVKGGIYFISIPPIQVSYEFSSRLLAVKPTSETAESHWWLAGVLTQVFDVAGISQVKVGEHKVQLNRPSLLILAAIAPYRLVFSPARWLRDIQLQIWEWKGPTEGISETLQAAVIDLVTGDDYELTFADTDLTDGLLTVSHNLGNQYPSGVNVWDSQNGHITPDGVQAVDANTLQVSLVSYAPLEGTWRVSVTP